MRLNLDSRLRLVTSRQSKFEKSRDDAPACNNSITCMSVNKTFSDIRSRELIFHQPLPFLLSFPPPPPHPQPSSILPPSLPFTAKMAKTATGSLNSVLPLEKYFFSSQFLIIVLVLSSLTQIATTMKAATKSANAKTTKVPKEGTSVYIFEAGHIGTHAHLLTPLATQTSPNAPRPLITNTFLNI